MCLELCLFFVVDTSDDYQSYEDEQINSHTFLLIFPTLDIYHAKTKYSGSVKRTNSKLNQGLMEWILKSINRCKELYTNIQISMRPTCAFPETISNFSTVYLVSLFRHSLQSLCNGVQTKIQDPLIFA